jgi:hypothetical protein
LLAVVTHRAILILYNPDLSSSRAMFLGLKQTLAQAGVILFIFWTTSSVWGPFFGQLFLPSYLTTMAWMPLFVVAALLPEGQREAWGSMWPLVGYDNAIDAIYTRGPWLARFEELDERARERQLTEGMDALFGRRQSALVQPD